MAEDIREAGVQVAVDLDLGDLGLGPVGGAGEGGDGLCAALNDGFGVALDEDFADEI